MHMLGKVRLGKPANKTNWERQERDSIALLEIVEVSLPRTNNTEPNITSRNITITEQKAND